MDAVAEQDAKEQPNEDVNQSPDGMEQSKADQDREIAVFDLNLYRSVRSRCPGILTPGAKSLLSLPEEERGEEQIARVIMELDDIPFFQRFSNDAKERLSRKLLFVTHEGGVCLLRDGQEEDPEQAMYVIVSGVVAVKCPISGQETEEKKFWQEKMLQRGKPFGVTDLLRKRAPSVEAHTVGYSELLMLKKDDFDIVRKVLSAYDKRLEDSLRSIATLTRFNWTEEEFKALELYARLATFSDNVEIFGGKRDKPSLDVFFVVDGECKIVRDLRYVVETGLGYKRFRSVDPMDSSPESLHQKIHKKKLEFGRLRRGNYFGVGEPLDRDHILSIFSVECLLVPRFLLVSKDSDLLSKMVDALSCSFPSDQAILDNYLEMLNWEKTKLKIMRQVLKEKPEMLVGHQAAKDKPRFKRYV